MQAKMLTADQITLVESYLSTRQDPLRETTILYLSVYAGLRAKEIAGLDWNMLLDASGNITGSITVTNQIAKGKNGGRVIPMHPKLIAVITQLHASYSMSPRRGFVLVSRNTGTCFSAHAIVQKFRGWYAACDLEGCSSHSGRRTFITKLARNINLHGGSLRDVQKLAGHSALSVTEAYIVANEDAQKNAIGAMW